MIRVYSAPTAALIAPVRDLLEANGIPCVLRNEFLSAGRGEIPITETWPEVWITDDDDLERAQELVAAATKPPDPAARRWRCPTCNERVDPVFARCWKCGTDRRS